VLGWGVGIGVFCNAQPNPNPNPTPNPNPNSNPNPQQVPEIEALRGEVETFAKAFPTIGETLVIRGLVLMGLGLGWGTWGWGHLGLGLGCRRLHLGGHLQPSAPQTPSITKLLDL